MKLQEKASGESIEVPEALPAATASIPEFSTFQSIFLLTFQSAPLLCILGLLLYYTRMAADVSTATIIWLLVVCVGSVSLAVRMSQRPRQKMD